MRSAIRYLPWLSALYVGAAVALAERVLLGSVDLAGVGWATLLGASVYLVDRVKPARRLLDPADHAADPERTRWERRHGTALRALAALAALAATVWGWFLHPLLAAVPIGAHLGGLAYGTVARPARLKDLLGIKNLAIGASIAALAGIVTLLTAGEELCPRNTSLVLGALALQIAADALASDLDDAATDPLFGTTTVPGRFGRRAAWLAFLATSTAATALLAVVPSGRVAAAALAATSLALGVLRPQPARAWVDARLPLAALVVIALAR